MDMSLDDLKKRLRQVDVMIVEDDQAQCEELRDFLDWSRVTYHVVNDGLSALEALEQLEPKVLILDIRLPGVDGIHVAKEVAKRPNPPVTILVSGHMDSVIEANESPAQRFRVIEKPVDLRLIGRFIHDALEKKPA
ncbi:MAG: response regulator [Alphaproteobacteria bacterium]|nr:response regulator [Alphaproteobacteria bacterium]